MLLGLNEIVLVAWLAGLKHIAVITFFKVSLLKVATLVYWKYEDS